MIAKKGNTMAQWRIKEISDLTSVSARMLRHYDKIGLLKPSVRASNGYRWYSEQDLATLQQIVALKFFGFSLRQIKTMLQHKLSIKKQLVAQQQLLKEQAEHLDLAQDAIATVLERVNVSQVPDWKDLILIIERYRMAEDIKKTWAGKVLDDSARAEYVALRQQHPKEFALWEKTIEEINSLQLGDPEGPEGEEVVKIFFDLVIKTKATWAEQRRFNSKLMQRIKAGTISDAPLTPEGNMWFAKATLAYWLKKWESIYEEIRKNLEKDPEGIPGKKIAGKWRELINAHFIGMSPDLVLGTMFWQEEARQRAELAELKTPPTAQDMIKKIHVKLAFDADALNWIERALESHEPKKNIQSH